MAALTEPLKYLKPPKNPKATNESPEAVLVLLLRGFVAIEDYRDPVADGEWSLCAKLP